MMNISKESISVPFKVSKESCPCCGRDFDDIQEGEAKQFLVSMEEIFTYMNWSAGDEIYEEDMVESVDEYLYNTIRFYALKSDETLQIERNEVEKVIAMVKEEIKKLPELELVN